MPDPNFPSFPQLPPFERSILASQGYFELGLYRDANDELETIEPERRTETPVLELRLAIYEALEDWVSMRIVAQTLAARDPQRTDWTLACAWATRHAASVHAGLAIILCALERQPGSTELLYHVARYTCRLGELPAARALLGAAISREPHHRIKAADEPDFAPFWD